MKEIIIYQDGGAPIIIRDDDSKPLEEYSREISALLESNNISILHTSTCSTIIRPSKISSISVSEIDTHEVSGVQKMEKVKEKTEEEIQEDIISD